MLVVASLVPIYFPSIPGNRCQYWLQLLERAGLLRLTQEGYAPSSVARKCILEAYSQDTWAFLAQEAREALPVLRDLALHFQNPGSAADAVGFVPTNYVKAMGRDPERARRFTQMLYEIHEPIAEELAVRLDLRGVERFMDLGGGSGVVSLALLRRSCLVSLLFFPPGLSLFGGLVRIWEHNVRSCVLAHDRKQAGRR